jgi:LytS/YehU family sensor histidine kinase
MEMQTKYETEKKDGEITQLNKDKKTQKTITMLAAAAAVVLLLFLILVIRSRHLQQKLFKQKEILIKKEKEIEKKALEQKMTELEQMALRAQMNPHFIFNSLNSVQHFVMNKDVEGVNRYLGIFARLVRQMLDNSGKALIPLDEEIKYLDTYLSLEKMKSNDKFNYAISVNNNIDPSGTFIPGMILQPFVENSILHGVSHKEKNDGLVKISISKNGRLICLIDDNGIGRQRSSVLKSNHPDHESKGMDITMHRIEAINKMYNSSISVQFTDMKDEAGNPSGTSVKVELPADME